MHDKSFYINLLGSNNPKTHIDIERCLDFYGCINTQQISVQQLHEYCVFMGLIN